MYEPDSFPLMLLIRQDSHPELSEAKQVIAQNMDMMQSMFEQMGSEAHSLRQQMRDQLIAQLKQMDIWDEPKLPQDYYFYHCNHLGLPDALTDKTGQVVWAAEYDPWGNLQSEHNPENLKQNIRLPGQYHDTDTGLYYNRHRYYDPKLGRYINQDPIGLNSGEPNFYSYPKNPLQEVDPLGLAPDSPPTTSNLPKPKLNIPDTGDVVRGVISSSRKPRPTARGDHAAYDACTNNGRILTCMERLDEYEELLSLDKSIGKNPIIQGATEAAKEIGKYQLCTTMNECDIKNYNNTPEVWPPAVPTPF